MHPNFFHHSSTITSFTHPTRLDCFAPARNDGAQDYKHNVKSGNPLSLLSLKPSMYNFFHYSGIHTREFLFNIFCHLVGFLVIITRLYSYLPVPPQRGTTSSMCILPSPLVGEGAVVGELCEPYECG